MGKLNMSAITEKILKLARERGVVRPRDVDSVRDASPYLRHLVGRGLLIKAGRGLYTLSDREPAEAFSLIQATTRVPRGVVCLISALEFHGFTTQIGYEVWLAVDHKWRLSVEDVPVRIVRMSGAAYEHGVEEHKVAATGAGGRRGARHTIRVFSPAKTVADCFRFRSKVGLDVALEALREGWRERKFTIDELMECARADRVQTVMRPYVEAIVS